MSERMGTCSVVAAPHFQEPWCNNWKPTRDWATDGPALERKLAQIGVELEALAKKWDKMEPRGGKNGGLKRIVRAEAKRECAVELRALAQQQGAK